MFDEDKLIILKSLARREEFQESIMLFWECDKH